MLPGARTIQIRTRTQDLRVIGGLVFVRGWSFRETTNSARAVFRLYDGASSNGAIIASISLSQGESTRDLLAGDGIAAQGGVFLDMISGSVEGAVWVNTAQHDRDLGIASGVLPVWSGQES